MDGLLIDSENFYTAAISEIALEHGLEPMPWTYRLNLMGRPGPEAAYQFLKWFFNRHLELSQAKENKQSIGSFDHYLELDHPDIQAIQSQLSTKSPYLASPRLFFAETSRRQRAHWPNNTQFLPGVKHLLETLKAHHTPIAVATSTNSKNFVLKTRHLGSFMSQQNESDTNKFTSLLNEPVEINESKDVFRMGHSCNTNNSNIDTNTTSKNSIDISTDTSAKNSIGTLNKYTTPSPKPWRFDLFDGNIITGDDERIPKGRGKPSPDIWLVALQQLNSRRREFFSKLLYKSYTKTDKLNRIGTESVSSIDKTGTDFEKVYSEHYGGDIKPHECLVFEDSFLGIQSAISAKMNYVWVPHYQVSKLLGNDKMNQLVNEFQAQGNQGDFEKSKHLTKGEIVGSLDRFNLSQYNIISQSV